MPCPLDPSHSCLVTGLERHLLVCNARAPASCPPYLVPGVNRGECDTCGDEAGGAERLNMADISDGELLELIDLVKRTFHKFLKNDLVTEQLEHDLMKEELQSKEYGRSVMKHHVQNSSLLAHLAQAALTADHTTYVEVSCHSCHASCHSPPSSGAAAARSLTGSARPWPAPGHATWCWWTGPAPATSSTPG